MGSDVIVVSRRRWGVVTGLLLALRISVGSSTPSACNDYGLRNIDDDEEDWRFYAFNNNECLICLDGGELSSLDAVLILPCLHQQQPPGSRVTVRYISGADWGNPIETFSDTERDCQTEYDSAVKLAEGPTMLDVDLRSRNFSGGAFFIEEEQRHLLKIENSSFSREFLICIKDVEYNNVKLANGTIVGSTVEITPSPSTTTAKGAATTTPTVRITKPIESSKASDMMPTATNESGNLPMATVTTMYTSKSTTASAPVTSTNDDRTQPNYASSREFETTSKDESRVTTSTVTSEESANSYTTEQEGSSFPKESWWIFLVLTIVPSGLVVLTVFGVCRRRNVESSTHSEAREKDNVYTEGIAFQSEDRANLEEGTIYNPVYGDNLNKDDQEMTKKELQFCAASVDYNEVKKWESTNGEMIYNCAYDGLALKIKDALPGDTAYSTVSAINSVGNKNGGPSQARNQIKDLVVYETVGE